MRHLLYLMFRCDFDVMESLEEFEDLNTPILSGTEHRAGQGRGRGPAATPQLAHSGTGKYAARKDADGDAFASCGAGSNKNIPRGQKLGALKIPGPGDQSDREGLRARNNHQTRGARGHLDISMARDVQKRKPQKLEEKALLWYLLDAMHPGAGLRLFVGRNSILQRELEVGPTSL